MATIAPIHPGEVLLEEFLVTLEVTQHRLAVSIGVTSRRINEIVHGKRPITADTARRLARYLGPPTGSGSTCRPATTSRSKRTTSAAHSKTFSRRRAPDPENAQRARQWRRRDAPYARTEDVGPNALQEEPCGFGRSRPALLDG
jgi:addiction module HigA family antidote